MNTDTELMTSADLGDCELCKKEFDSGDYCKTIHNHCLGDDIVCCRCWCAANPKFHCPDAWRYLEEEEEEKEEMTYDEYVETWSSSWGGDKGSEEANVWWDLLGHTESGTRYCLLYDNTLLDLNDEKKCIECLKDKTKICIVKYL